MNTRRLLFAIGIAVAAPCWGQIKEQDIRPAAAKSVGVLLATSKAWFGKQSCPTCHHQDLPMMVFNLARHRGVPVDRNDLQQILRNSLTSTLSVVDIDQMLQGSDLLNPAMGFGARLVAAAPLGFPRTLGAETVARLIARRQRSDGHWTPGDDIRPPQSFSAFTTTANALRAIQLFLPDSMSQERQIRVRNARLWLERTPPIDTEDRVYQLLGLFWAGSRPDMIAMFRDQLLAEQRPNGGWGQIPDRPSDAYATGEALSALNRAAGVLPSHCSWQRGLRYLLQTQKADGTWFVSSRLNPPAPLSPPYFDSGFPYGHDQFISAMGTSWAASALLLALPESNGAPEPLDLSTLNAVAAPAWAETVLFGRLPELRKLIATGWDVNSATPKGTTALMMAAPDADKVSLLLQHGANLNARSKTRYTALMIALSHNATDSVRLLLEHHAEVTSPMGQPVQHGSTPVFLATLSGNEKSLQALQHRGAVTRSTILAGGFFPVTPLSVAVEQRDLAMVKALIRSGVPVDDVASPNDGLTALDFSVFANDTKMAALLLAAGADVNHVDRLGYTPLLWAANVDFGDSAMVSLLLRAGANRKLKQRDNLTALELALKYKYTRHQKVLRQN